MLAGEFGEKLQRRRRPGMVPLSLELEKHHMTGVLYLIHCILFFHFSLGTV